MLQWGHMRHNKLIAILGIWVIALAFLGFSESLTRIFLVLTGFLLIVVAVKKKPLVKSNKDFIEQFNQTENLRTDDENKTDTVNHAI